MHKGANAMTKHKGKIICAFIVILVLAGIWYHREANTIFPLDEEAIIGVIVSEENDLYQSRGYSTMPADMQETLIAYFNTLTLKKDDVPLLRHSQELGQQNVLYEVLLDYAGIRAEFMRSFRVDLYICADGRIIVWNGGYEYYDVVDGDYDALLSYLAICDQVCFTSATLQDGTIIREK